MFDLDDLLAIDDEPRGVVQTGGLSVAEPCANSAELEAWAELASDSAYQRASAILFVDVDEQTGEEVFSNARTFADMMASIVPPDQATVVAWQAELMTDCWRRYGGPIWEARNRGQ